MQYHKQLNLHDPENGVYGDCARTAIACLLNLHPSEVPHFMDGDPSPEVYHKREREFLSSIGLTLVGFALHGDITLEQILTEYAPSWFPGVRYMLTGKSPRGTNHVVIVENNKIHDPAIPGGDLVGPTNEGSWWIEFLVPAHIHRLEVASCQVTES